MRIKISLWPALGLIWAAGPLSAAVIGTIPPAQSVTAARVRAVLPADQQGPWLDYLARSDRAREADHAYVAAELTAAGMAKPIIPGEGRGGISLNQPDSWYGSAEAVHSADVIVSYQMPNGAWGKNLNMRDNVRTWGGSFVGNNLSQYLAPGDYDTPRDPYWNYFGTLDNNATTTQLRFLAKVVTALGPQRGAPYRAAFLRGIDYLFAAQYPNGGWPQVWPLEGGYHDAITFNDDAVTQAIEVLQGIALGQGMYAFTSADLRRRAAPRVALGYACIVACQIQVDGRRTVWCQQHDALTLQPTSARNFEPVAQCGDESSNVAKFLMTVPSPSPEIVASVHAAAAWFRKVAIHDQVWSRGRGGFGGGRPPRAGAGAGQNAAGLASLAAPATPRPAPTATHLVPTPGAPLLWARYYEIGSDRPVFGDRDKTMHDKVEELSLERQRGYNWYNSGPQEMLETYDTWSAAHPGPSS
jgi:PelA/Pel-15E family pectate lyase